MYKIVNSPMPRIVICSLLDTVVFGRRGKKHISELGIVSTGRTAIEDEEVKIRNSYSLLGISNSAFHDLNV